MGGKNVLCYKVTWLFKLGRILILLNTVFSCKSRVCIYIHIFISLFIYLCVYRLHVRIYVYLHESIMYQSVYVAKMQRFAHRLQKLEGPFLGGPTHMEHQCMYAYMHV